MTKTLNYFNALLIAGMLFFSACGMGDSTSSGITDLSKASHEDILNAIANKKLTENIDAGGGYMEYDITLKVKKDGSFTYRMEESTDGTVDYIEATGKMTFEGDVKKVTTVGASYQYEQSVLFKGTTDEGSTFKLKGKIIQFVYEEGGMQDFWNISYDTYAISDQQSISLTNYRLPFDDFNP